MSDPLSPETLAEIEAVPREVADAMVLGTRANISYADAEELWSAMMDAWGRTLLAEVRRQTAEIERLRAEREWRPIETAPKDGTHILACFATRPFGPTWGFAQRPPTVVHWFGPPDLPGLRSGGWYLSVQTADSERVHPTHWQPLPAPPISPETWKAEIARLAETDAGVR